MNQISRTWLEIFSELFVNIAAAWFVLAFIEPQIVPIRGMSVLIMRIFFGTISLVFAQQFREQAKEV